MPAGAVFPVMRVCRWLAIGAVGLCVLGAGTASAATPRLNKTQWAAYQKQHTAFTQRTTKSVARFRYCLSSTTGSRNARAMQTCFGNTADLELTVTQRLSTLLRSFQTKVRGACKTSLGKYQGPLFFWQSTITGLKRAVHSNVANAATIEGSATQARQIYPQVTAAATAFAKACKPLA
jgi:hypothetical protein